LLKSIKKWLQNNFLKKYEFGWLYRDFFTRCNTFGHILYYRSYFVFSWKVYLRPVFLSPLDQQMVFPSDTQVWIFYAYLQVSISLLSFKSSDLRIANEGSRSGTMLYPEPGFSFRAFSKISSLSIKLDRRSITLFRPTWHTFSLCTALNNML
jgi:hypothetical protein